MFINTLFIFFCFVYLLSILYAFVSFYVLFLLLCIVVSVLFCTILPTTATNGNPITVNKYHIISQSVGGQTFVFSAVLMKNKGVFSVR